MSPSVRLARLLVAAIGALAVLGCDGNPIGAACAKDSDCGSGSACVYKIADGCAAKPTCQTKPTGPLCHLIAFYCGCEGTDVAVDCSQPPGYAPAAVTQLKTGPTCPSPSNDASSD